MEANRDILYMIFIGLNQYIFVFEEPNARPNIKLKLIVFGRSSIPAWSFLGFTTNKEGC